jgi:hypothetical protein
MNTKTIKILQEKLNNEEEYHVNNILDLHKNFVFVRHL